MTEPQVTAAPAATGSARRRFAAAGIGVLIVTVGGVFMVRALARDWDAVQAAVREANWWLLAAGVAAAFIAVWLLAAQWHAALAALGHHPPLSAATRWFMAGQLGKYLPGGVWHAVGVGELATRGGVPRRPAYGSTGLSTISLIGSAAVLVAVGGLLTGGEGVRWWTVAGAATLCGALFVTPLRRVVFRLAGAAPEAAGSARKIALLIAHGLPAWLCIGAATWCVTAALGSHTAVGTTIVVAVTSWLVGILALPAPGGIGVREAVLVLALRTEMGIGPATAAAVTARLAFIVADIGWLPLSRLLPGATSSAPAPSSTAAD